MCSTYETHVLQIASPESVYDLTIELRLSPCRSNDSGGIQPNADLALRKYAPPRQNGRNAGTYPVQAPTRRTGAARARNTDGKADRPDHGAKTAISPDQKGEITVS